jgi:hypothetical protein
MKIVIKDGWKVPVFTKAEMEKKKQLYNAVLISMDCLCPCGCPLNTGPIQNKKCLGVDRDCIYQRINV